MSKLIVSLCDYSKVWAVPYVEAGYKVACVDIAHPAGESRDDLGIYLIGADVTKMAWPWVPYAVLAAPPCTCFCRPAARWWKRQDERGDTAANVAIMRACLRLCRTATGWWALENPPGRHQKLIPELGEPSWQYHPWQYGDPWGKQTYIWGTSEKPPVVSPVKPQATTKTPNGRWQGRIAKMSSSWKRQREQTPAGFSRAFFEANP